MFDLKAKLTVEKHTACGIVLHPPCPKLKRISAPGLRLTRSVEKHAKFGMVRLPNPSHTANETLIHYDRVLVSQIYLREGPKT